MNKGESGLNAALIANNLLIRDRNQQIAMKGLDLFEDILKRASGMLPQSIL